MKNTVKIRIEKMSDGDRVTIRANRRDSDSLINYYPTTEGELSPADLATVTDRIKNEWLPGMDAIEARALLMEIAESVSESSHDALTRMQRRAGK